MTGEDLTGLGREDFFFLHQKQSIRAIDPDGLLAISNGLFMTTNAANTGTLTNGNYLVWGDNNKSFCKSATADGQLQMLNRQWLYLPENRHKHHGSPRASIYQFPAIAGSVARLY